MAYLGKVLRAHRERYGMSQVELSRRIHISQTALNQLERGQTVDPHFSIVQNIAAVLGLSLDHVVKEAQALQGETMDTASKSTRKDACGHPHDLQHR
jgi:transcriptional regulator with XRE-family HTH domain